MNEFTVGSECICVRSHPCNLYTKGLTYTVLAIREGFCKCVPSILDIGLTKGKYQHFVCARCSARNMTFNHVLWVDSQNFAPIGSASQVQSELDSITIPELEPLTI
jgi:hypothetical protein